MGTLFCTHNYHLSSHILYTVTIYTYLFVILILFQNIHIKSISEGIPQQTYTSTAPTLRYQTILTQF